MKKSLEQPNIGDSTENSKVADLDAIVSESKKKDLEAINFNRLEKSDPLVNRDATLAEIRKKDLETEHRERATKAADLVLNHIVDEEGNIIKYFTAKLEVGLKPQKNFYQVLEDLGYKDRYGGGADLDLLMHDGFFQEELIKRTSSEKTALDEKIIILQLIGECLFESFREDEANMTRELEYYLELAIKDERNPYLYKIIAKNNLDNAKDWDPVWQYENEQEEENGTACYTDFNDKFYSDKIFSFSDKTTGIINSERADDHYYANLWQIEKDDEGYYRGDYIACKMSPQILGFYTMNGNLAGWKNISEIDSDKKVNNSGILLNNLNFSDQDELAIFKLMASLPVRAKIKEDLGIDIAELNLRTQYQFLQFIKQKPASEINEIKKFFDGANKKEGKTNRIKSFLSLEQGEEMGEVILSIGEKLDAEDADMIFTRYSEIVDITENIKEKLSEQFKDKEASQEDITGVSEQILKKANCLLINFSEKIKDGEKIDHKAVLKELDDYRSDILLTLGIYKQFKGEVDIENIKDVSFEQTDVVKYAEIKEKILKLGQGEEIESGNNELIDEVKQMFALYDKNYSKRPEFLKVLKPGFAQALAGSSARLSIMKKGDKIIGFNRMEQTGPGKKHFGSCNVLPAAQALSIGEALFEKTIQAESRGNEIEATCDAFTKKSSAPMYIEKGNFVIEKIDTESDPDGIPWFIIKRERDEERKNYYQGEENRDLISEFKNQTTDLDKLQKMPHFILSFADASDELKSTCIDLVNNEDYRITRYFTDKKTKKIYLAFEKSSS